MLEPYRSPDPPVTPPLERPVAELNEKQRLGLLRSVHRPLPLWRGVFPPLVLGLATLLLGLVIDPHFAGLAITAAPAATLVLVLGAGPWRRRHLAVDVHAHGVVVRTAERRDVILFEDVDALYWDLDVGSFGGKRQARIEGIRLVDHEGVTHHVPMLVDEPVEAVNWIQRHCSDHLLPDAQASIRAGGTLTFGSVRIDRAPMLAKKLMVRPGFRASPSSVPRRRSISFSPMARCRANVGPQTSCSSTRATAPRSPARCPRR